ncbi:MAG: monovalent cation/H(+) antiporter subunit G [Planctomycetales bacterium]|nr:monovalent cation/H(+) antiporter subunit G [Planctomycetales bacterium]
MNLDSISNYGAAFTDATACTVLAATTWVHLTAHVSLVVLVISLCLAFLRLVLGPSLPDRVGCTILAPAVQFADMETTTVAILVIGFIFLTTPVAAHMIGRAAHRLRVPE